MNEEFDPPPVADEHTMTTAFLNLQREEVVRKCAGLTEELAHRRVLAPTSPKMSVAGLVSHLRWVENNWYNVRLLGEPDLGPWTEEDPDGEFEVDDVPLARLLAEYRTQWERSNEIAESLDYDRLMLAERRGERFSLRWIQQHLIEETARHAGHLDIMRELLDGARDD